MCSSRRREEAELRGCQFDSTTNLCYSHKGPVKKGNGETFAGCRIFRSLAEELGNCVSDDTPNEIPRELRQTYSLTHSLPFQSRVGEQECLDFCLQEKRFVVLGCEYIRADDGQSATCEAIVNKPGARHFKGGDGVPSPEDSDGFKVCWKIQELKTIKKPKKRPSYWGIRI